MNNKEIVRELLEGATDRETVYKYVAPDATYMSLTFDNPDLRKLMPWAGIHRDGPAGILWTFQTLHSFWHIEDMQLEDVFGEGDKVAVFGRFTTHSVRLDKKFVSPFAVFARLDQGKVVFMQYMEDTFGTGSTFRSGGTWTFQADPGGGEVTVG